MNLTKQTLTIMMASTLLATTTWAADIPVTVHRFYDKSNATDCRFRWDYWQDRLGSAFQEMLISELSEKSGLEVLERAQIKEIYSEEVELLNSEKSSEKIEKGQFKKARYTFIGTITGFEYCADQKQGRLKVGELAERAGIGGLFGSVASAVNSVGAAKSKAKVVIDVRLVHTATGKIVKSVKAEGIAERSNFNFDSDIGEFESSEDSPVTEAARKTIAEASQKLVAKIK